MNLYLNRSLPKIIFIDSKGISLSIYKDMDNDD